MDDYKMQNEIFNDFVQDVDDEDNTLKEKNINKFTFHSTNLPKEEEKEDNKINNNYKTKEEKITEYKVLKLRNELLIIKLKERETKLRDIKKKCEEQAKKIEKLKKMVTENMLKQNKNNPQQKNEINMKNKGMDIYYIAKYDLEKLKNDEKIT